MSTASFFVSAAPVAACRGSSVTIPANDLANRAPGLPTRGWRPAGAPGLSPRRGAPPYAAPIRLPPSPSEAAAFAAGLTNGEVAVQYQPVVRLGDRRPVMVEALARWNRPLAAVPPEHFVSLAAEIGLLRALSMRVAGQAATELAPLWQSLRLRVSVNLPLGLLLQPDLPRWLARALRLGGLHPAQVVLELTETTTVQDRSTLRRALLRLRDAGHRVLLDDIILHDDRDWLLDLPFGGFKLDRSLVERLPTDAHIRHEVLHLVKLAEAGGKLVIAEGVSDQRLWNAVRALGVHHAQGYLVSRPLPAHALPAWSGRWRGGQAAA